MAIKHTKLLFAAFLAVLSFGFLNLFTTNALAEGENKAAVNLQVTPTKTKLSLAPGETYIASMRVMNVGSIDFRYTTEATPYSVVDSQYSPDYDGKNNYTQIADWITFDEKTQEGVIEPGKDAEVTFTINVPKDAPAGGQYAAIMAQTGSGNDEDANIKTISRVGMILYASVAGNTREEGNILNNSIPSVVFTPPISISYLVENTGNIETSATSSVRIWKLFDKETVYNNDDRPSTVDVIPGTSRFSTVTWDNAPKIGVFWAEQTVNYVGKISTNHKFIVVCPIWLLVIIFALIFFMIFWLFSRVRARKNGGKRSERKSRRHGRKEAAKEAPGTEGSND